MPIIEIGGHRGGKRQVEPVYAEIDDDDVEKVNQYKWGFIKQGNTIYGKTHTGGKKIWLHRFIMGLGDYKDDKRIIDHKDGNGLNNKKENLTICDTLYNSQSFRRHHGKCNVGWVYERKEQKGRRKRFLGTITINKIKYSKYFFTEEEAKEWIDLIIKDHTF